MNSPVRFSSLVLAAVVSWAAVAGALALSSNGVAGASVVHSFAGTFPTAEAGFASRPTPVAN